MARFFRALKLISPDGLIDFIYRRYHSPEVVLAMPFRDGLELLESGLEHERDQMLHRQWCALLPLMNMKMLAFEPFNQYKERLTGSGLDLRPADEIVEEIKALHGIEEE